MRVRVTGATGNVGTSVIDALISTPEVTSIVGLARRCPEWRPPGTAWIEADITHHDLRPIFSEVDAVVHLAWRFQPTHEPLATWQSNVCGTLRVLRAAVEAGVQTIVYASSVGAYSPEQNGSRSARQDETWPTHAIPTAAYGREKSYVERVLDIFEHDHPEIRLVRMRPAFIFKPEAATEQRRIFGGPLVPGRVVGIGARRLPVVPFVDGLSFQALHAADAASAYVRALTHDVRGAFNIAPEPVLNAATISDTLGARVVNLPRRGVRTAMAAAWRTHLGPAEPNLLDLVMSLPLMDTTRAREELGWSPVHTAKDAIRSFLDGLEARAGFPTPPLTESPSPIHY